MSDDTDRPNDVASEVGAHYDAIVAFEEERLEKHHPAEYGITCRYLDRYIDDGARVIEVGVGVGRYSGRLARRGCSLVLVDVSQNLLDAAVARVRSAGYAKHIAGVHLTSATDLSFARDASCDAALLLGPLYHLTDESERRKAVGEAARVCRKGGLVFAAGINRLAYLRDALHFWPEESVGRRAFHERYMLDGNLDPAHAPPLGHAHLSTVDEFRGLFVGAFDELAFCGAESFASPWQHKLADLTGDQREAWLDLIERTGTTAEGIAAADHFLYVGRRR